MTLIRTNNGLYPAQHCVFKRTVENGEDYLMLSCFGTVEFFRIMYNFEGVLDEIVDAMRGVDERNAVSIIQLSAVISTGDKKPKLSSNKNK